MEDLRNLDVDIIVRYDLTHDAYVVIIEGNAFRMNQDQVIDLHNNTTAELASKVSKC